jgi:hypothetical protein
MAEGPATDAGGAAPLLGSLEVASSPDGASKPQSARDSAAGARILVIAFASMLVVGVGNRVFSVLQYTPMANYALFINLLVTFAYIPTSLLYVLPLVYGVPGGVLPAKGWGCMSAKPIPQKAWAIMGFLDSVAGVMQAIAIDKIANGSLVVLLLQSAIPLSMIITKVFLKTVYTADKIVGASIVTGGIILVLGPALADGAGGASTIGFALMLVASCIPMTLSSVYKERALGDVEIDPI